MVFGYVAQIRKDFYDFISPRSLQFKFRQESCIKQSRPRFVKKHCAKRRLFNASLGVWKFNETRSFVFGHSYGLRYYWKYFESKRAFTIRWRKLKTQLVHCFYLPSTIIYHQHAAFQPEKFDHAGFSIVFVRTVNNLKTESRYSEDEELTIITRLPSLRFS